MDPLQRLARIPGFLTPYLAFLPRPVLNRLEISCLPASFDTLPSAESLRKSARKLRWALVKQCIYPDLYSCPPRTAAREAVFSTLQRMGPAALLVDLAADFWLVHEDPAPECQVWEESVGSHVGTDLAKFRAEQNQVPHGGRRGHHRTPAQDAVQVGEVPWNQYDVVVSVDVAVPERILKAHPGILWVTLPADPGTPTAKAGWEKPPFSWDVNLTHLHRRFPVRPGLGSRTVECPYSLQSPFTWTEVFGSVEKSPRSGCFLETQTHAALDPYGMRELTTLGPVGRPLGSLPDVARALRESRYYVQMTGGPLTGNGQIEAIFAGCLAVGNPASYVQRSLFLPGLEVTTRPLLLALLRRLEADPARREALRGAQQAVAEYLCFRRPLHRLLALQAGHLQKRPQ